MLLFSSERNASAHSQRTETSFIFTSSYVSLSCKHVAEIKLTNPEKISAIGNAHQIAESTPVLERIKAAGRNGINCLTNRND